MLIIFQNNIWNLIVKEKIYLFFKLVSKFIDTIVKNLDSHKIRKC